ncbi:hypothetical protein K435DRAFT_656689, partial [Dendrothele bispora CBS 962.96]
LGIKFHSSDTLQGKLIQACKANSLSPKKMIRAIDTCWNTMSDVIDHALYLRLPLDRVLSMTKYSKTDKGCKDLSHLKLSPEEWDLLIELQPMLKWFKKVTEHFSKSNCPLLFEVIPYIDSLTNKLERVVNDFTKAPIIRAATAKSRAVLNKYYGKTDIMYHMCMRCSRE